jgi:hypothetical protein
MTFATGSVAGGDLGRRAVVALLNRRFEGVIDRKALIRESPIS